MFSRSEMVIGAFTNAFVGALVWGSSLTYFYWGDSQSFAILAAAGLVLLVMTKLAALSDR